MDFVEQLKSSIDIVKVVGEYVRLQARWRHRPLHRAVPVPSGKDAVLQRQPDAPVLQMLRLRRGRRRAQVRDGDRRADVSRSPEAAGRAQRHPHAEAHRVLRRRIEAARRAASTCTPSPRSLFQANLRGPQGAEARAYLAKRGVCAGTDRNLRAGLFRALRPSSVRGVWRRNDSPPEQMEASGLVRRAQ